MLFSLNALNSLARDIDHSYCSTLIKLQWQEVHQHLSYS